eukprot:scaffold35477_cov43-Cyclotella_meneghiniana.AAC.1
MRQMKTTVIIGNTLTSGLRATRNLQVLGLDDGMEELILTSLTLGIDAISANTTSGTELS